MFRRSYFSIFLILVLCMVGSVSAQDWVDIEWDNDDGDGNRMWDTGVNWDLDRAPIFGDNAILDNTYTDDSNGPIIEEGINAECDWFEMGFKKPAIEEVVMTMTGGTLTATEWIDIGGYNSGNFRFDMSGGEITVIGQGDGTWEGLYIGYNSGADAVMNISGGDIDLFGWVWMGWETSSRAVMNMSGGTLYASVGFEIGSDVAMEAVLNMTGGTIRADEWLGIGVWHDGGGNGTLNLHGGVMDAYNVYMGPVSHLDVTEGVLLCDTDLTVANGWLYDPLYDEQSDTWDDTAYTGTLEILAERGRITAYDVNCGAIITDVNYPAEVGKRAVVLFDYGLRNAGKTTLLATTTEPEKAWRPEPFDEAIDVRLPELFGLISWSAGDGAAEHDVYFGTDFSAVDAATHASPEYIGLPQGLEDVNYTPSFKWGTTYYWRVDEVNGTTVEKGYVWTFSTVAAKAYNPKPGDDEEGVSVDIVLSWMPGPEFASHELYFSSDFNDVNERSIGFAVPGANSYSPPINLELDKTYYWAVDEVNLGAEVQRWYGDAWRFRTRDHLVVDNFDSYSETDELRAVWNDGWLNDTGSEVTSETEIVRDGKSMKYEYYNSDPMYNYIYYSEIEADTSKLEVESDWRYGGVESFGLWFYGDGDNDANEQMYIVVKDSVGREAELPYDGDMNDIREDEWQEWNIGFNDFNEVEPDLDLTDISMVYIGFGIRGNDDTPGGEGTVWFDDIRLYPRRCVSAFSYGHGDITGDCLIEGSDLLIMSSDWLAYDYNTVGRPGTLVNYDDPDSAWTSGKIGGALHFAGGGDPNVSGEPLECVEIEPLFLKEPDADGVTISAWIKPDGAQNDYSGIVFSRDETTISGLSLRDNNELVYHWDDVYWDFETNLYAKDDTWSFVALVVTEDEGTIYLGSGTKLDSIAKVGTHNIEPFAGITRIGEDNNADPRHFKGLIDDVRIYKYALSQSQIDDLSELSGEPSPGPLVRYELDETSGTIASDSIMGTFYHEVGSAANVYDEEAQYHKSINFRDYSILADYWLEEILFPTP